MATRKGNARTIITKTAGILTLGLAVAGFAPVANYLTGPPSVVVKSDPIAENEVRSSQVDLGKIEGHPFGKETSLGDDKSSGSSLSGEKGAGSPLGAGAF